MNVYRDILMDNGYLWIKKKTHFWRYDISSVISLFESKFCGRKASPLPQIDKVTLSDCRIALGGVTSTLNFASSAQEWFCKGLVFLQITEDEDSYRPRLPPIKVLMGTLVVGKPWKGSTSNLNLTVFARESNLEKHLVKIYICASIGVRAWRARG